MTPRFTTLVSMPAPLMFLPISSRMRMSASTGTRAIQDFTSARLASSRCSMASTGTASSWAVLCQDEDDGIHRNPGHPGFHQRQVGLLALLHGDRKSTRLNSSHLGISYAVFCL